MGLIPQGILGPVSNKVGPVVGTTWKGRAVIKGYQPNVANPRTPAQQQQRSLFSYWSVQSKKLKQFIMPQYFTPFAGDITGFNIFQRENMKLTSDVWPDLTVTPGTMSLGSLPFPVTGTSIVAESTGSTVTFTWTSTELENLGIATDDWVDCVIQNSTQNEIGVVSSGRALVSAESFIINVNSGFTVGDNWHGYMQSRTADGVVITASFIDSGIYTVEGKGTKGRTPGRS